MIDILLSLAMPAHEAATRINRALLDAHIEAEAVAFSQATYRTRDLDDTIRAAREAAPSLRFRWKELEARP